MAGNVAGNVAGSKKRKLLHSVIPLGRSVDVEDLTNGDDDIDDFEDEDNDGGGDALTKKFPNQHYHSNRHSLHRSDSVRSGSSSCSSSSGYSSSSSSAVHDYDPFGCSGDSASASARHTAAHQVILVHDPTALVPQEDLAATSFTSSSSSSSTSSSSTAGREQLSGGSMGGGGGGRGEGLCSQLLQFQHPVVLILSSVGDRDAMYWRVKELFPEDLQSR